MNLETISKPHIFLTGEKQIGKSTLLKRMLEHTGLKYAGLKSVSHIDADGNRRIYLAAADGAGFDESHLAGICSGNGFLYRNTALFDDYAVGLLEAARASNCDCIVIDEIGNLEEGASLYSNMVQELLGLEDRHVFGVLQKKCDSELGMAIRNHKNVKMLAVTENNRNELADYILSYLK